MKKQLSFIIIGLVTLLGALMPVTAMAASNVFDANGTNDVCGNKGAYESAACSSQRKDNPVVGPKGILNHAVHLLGFVGGIAATIVIFVAGIYYVVSEGQSEQVALAKRALIGALVGLVIIILAQAIITYVLDRL